MNSETSLVDNGPKPAECHSLSKDDSECESSRQRMLEQAVSHISSSESCIPEIEEFIQHFEKRVKTLRSTGLPAFAEKFKREYGTMKALASVLEEPGLDEETLKLSNRKLEASGTILRQGVSHWDILKRCRSLVAVNRTVQGSAKDDRKRAVSKVEGDRNEKQQLHRTLKEQGKTDVHIVEGGGEWIDIRLLQADRLARQMTDSGWGWGDYDHGDDVDPDEWEDIPLAKQVRRLTAAARLNRHEYRTPRVRVILPNLSRSNIDIDVLLNQLVRIDSHVEVVIEDCDSSFLTRPPLPFDDALQNMLGNPLDGLTETLNMDHTILIDLISDITHFALQPQPWHGRTTKAQIEEERSQKGVMARTLYPILENRVLTCTQEAAEHFHEVLKTVGTATERERGRLLVPFDEETISMSPGAICRRFEELSVHPLPSSMQVPVHILTEPWTLETVWHAVENGRLPRVALDVVDCGAFKSSKLSIYMYGWASKFVTVTSNKEVRGQIRTWVEANRHNDEEVGPAIWLVDITRNLLAKNATPPEGLEELAVNGDSGAKDDTE